MSSVAARLHAQSGSLCVARWANRRIPESATYSLCYRKECDTGICTSGLEPNRAGLCQQSQSPAVKGDVGPSLKTGPHHTSHPHRPQPPQHTFTLSLHLHLNHTPTLFSEASCIHLQIATPPPSSPLALALAHSPRNDHTTSPPFTHLHNPMVTTAPLPTPSLLSTSFLPLSGLWS